MKLLHLALLFALLLTVLPAAAQENDPLALLLTQIEDALANDDLTTAQALLPGAAALVDGLLADCPYKAAIKNLLEDAASAADATSAGESVVGAKGLVAACAGETTTTPPPLGTTPDEVLPALGYERASGQDSPPIRTPIEINLTDSNANYKWGYEYLPNSYQDFVLYTNMTWNDPSHSCQVDFQSGNGNFYKLIFYNNGMQLQYFANGQWMANFWSFPTPLSTAAGSSHDVVIEVKGIMLTVYIDGIQVIQTPIQVIGSGSIAFLGAAPVANPQTTSCTFSNTWVWQP